MGIGNRIGRNKKEVDKAEYDKYQKWEKEQKSFQEKSLKSNDEYIKKYSIGIDSLPNIFGKLAGAASSFLSEGALDGSIQLLEGQAQDVANSFGVARGRIEEFKQVIADASPELVKMGIDQTKVAENYGAIAKEMGGAASLGTEAIVEMSAAAKVSGQDVGKLAQEFRNVGVSMYDVGDQMKEVANYARSVGVSVSAVSAGVVGNLGKLNTFNFDGGVNGLAKMAAQASRLGIDMGKVFKIADDLFSPEKAIDMSAALQRLGVTSSGLLDPLRAMDMAQNDPQALQNEIVNISKEFTKFNEQTGKFEIMPGSKRRLREVAEAMGMTAEELAGMSIKAADFDKKMSQIKMPNFAEGDSETKELIASMAQMKGGVATINVKDEKTGEVTLKQVDQLTPEDIEKLKNSQAEQGKSIEQLAVDQLTQLQQINAGISGVETSSKFGVATSEPIEKLYNASMEMQRGIVKTYSEKTGTKDFRDVGNQITQPVEDYITAKIKGDEKGESAAIDNFLSTMVKFEQEQKEKQQNYFMEAVKSVQDNFKASYDKPKEVKTTSDVNMNWKIDVSGNADGKTREEIYRTLDERMKDPSFLAEFKKLLGGGTAPSATTGGKNQ
jgi:hypothetical protein